MCLKSDTIAHDLFYPQDAERERQAPRGRFSIHRGKDFSVAYSYTTPIAVYPDKGGFVLLDSTRFSNTTSKHQCSIRRAVPYNVRRVECDWLGKNGIWYAPRYDAFEPRFRKFTRDVAKEILRIGRSDSDYAYSRKRHETLNRLNGLRKLAEVSAIRMTILSRVEKRVAAVTSLKRIESAQKRVAGKRKEERMRILRRQREDRLLIDLNRLFETNEKVEQAVTDAAGKMLQRFPYHQWRWLPEALKTPRSAELKQIQAFTGSAVREAAAGLRKRQYGSSDTMEDCDIRWHSDGLFHTTKGVAIPYAELQRCLELWKSRRLLGEVVDNRFHVLRNDEEVLIIGCHCFRRETVQQIWDRYARKTPQTIAFEETLRKQESMRFICQVMQPLLKLVQRELRKVTDITNKRSNHEN